MKGDAGLDQYFETGFFDFDLIDAGRKIRQVVFAGAVGRDFVAEICGRVGGGDFGVGDESFGRIGDAARDRGAGGLGAKNRGRRKEEEQQENGDSAHVFNQVARNKETLQYPMPLRLAIDVAPPLLAVLGAKSTQRQNRRSARATGIG